MFEIKLIHLRHANNLKYILSLSYLIFYCNTVLINVSLFLSYEKIVFYAYDNCRRRGDRGCCRTTLIKACEI